MTQAHASTCHDPVAGAIRIAAPRLGDVLSGALHRAYDDQGAMPDAFAALLAKLDRVERRPN